MRTQWLSENSNEKYVIPSESIIFYAILVMFTLSISFSKWSIATIPIRSVISIWFIIYIFVYHYRFFVGNFKKIQKAVLFILATGVPLTVASALQGTSFAVTARGIVEITIQACVALMIGQVAVAAVGARKVVKAFVLAFSASAAIALLQGMNLSFAWELREAIGRLSSDLVSDELIYLVYRTRPMGLALTPVVFATHVALLFATAYLFLSAERPKKLVANAAVVVLGSAFLAIVTGNRSLLLGIAVFIIVWLPLRKPVWFVVVMPVFVGFFVGFDQIMKALEVIGGRVFIVGDNSSEGREVLRELGVRLFFDHPLGYGVAFNSVDRWQSYWTYLSSFSNAQVVQKYAAHNYYLLILNKYGVMIIPFAILSISYILKKKNLLISLVPYLVHIYYHNDGPLQSDFLIWYLFPTWIACISDKK